MKTDIQEVYEKVAGRKRPPGVHFIDINGRPLETEERIPAAAPAGAKDPAAQELRDETEEMIREMEEVLI